MNKRKYKKYKKERMRLSIYNGQGLVNYNFLKQGRSFKREYTSNWIASK